MHVPPRATEAKSPNWTLGFGVWPTKKGKPEIPQKSLNFRTKRLWCIMRGAPNLPAAGNAKQSPLAL